ncbi:small multi-drug export protein [Candidatus Saccharibacteria bacterium]|nr:small multi-drug export protein [Candidatus Saccharibacteria bacterium]
MIVLHCLLVLLVSMVPIIELRGAIPIGVGLGVPEPLALLLAIIGNMIPVPFIYKFSRKLLTLGEASKISWLHKFCSWCLKKGERAGAKLQKKAGDNIFLALFLFVGIPLPGTGVWTGTLAASLLDLDYRKTVKAIICGVLLAGAIILAISFGIFELIF